jgi:putative peptidoglycan lipid II flippase
VLGSYAISVSTAILPHMARQAAVGDWPALKETLSFSMRLVSFITIPAAAGLMILRQPIVNVLFEHGKFMAESTQLTARALLYYAAGLPAFSAVRLVVPAFYSQQDTRTPVAVAAAAVGLNIVLNALLLRYLFPVVMNGGPALATSLAAYFNFAILMYILRRRLGKLGVAAMARSVTKVCLGTAAMAVACLAMFHFSGFETATHFVPRAMRLGTIILGAVAVYLVAAKLLRCAELDELKSLMRRPPAPDEPTAALVE